jgi:hypothetical protein
VRDGNLAGFLEKIMVGRALKTKVYTNGTCHTVEVRFWASNSQLLSLTPTRKLRRFHCPGSIRRFPCSHPDTFSLLLL